MDSLQIIHSDHEPTIEMKDRGFSTPCRIFQLEIDGTSEPEVCILIPAGKAVNDNRMWYHVIKEDAYGLDPNGAYTLLPDTEIKNILKIDLNLSTETNIIQDLSEQKDIEVSICAYSQNLRVYHVTDDVFNDLGKNIAKEDVDTEYIKMQRYFHVMTNLGLIIFKRIDK